MSNISYILGSDSITVFHGGNSYTVNRQAPTFGLVLDAVNKDDPGKLDSALNIRQNLYGQLQKLSDSISIRDNEIFYGDRAVTGLVASRIFEMLKLKMDITPMVRFLENLMKNPSKRAVDELFGFLDACKLPITADGHFLAYKRVRADYLDCHSATMNNSVGEVLQMERNMVDEDRNNTCSYGLHFCSYSYLSSFGGDRIMVLKINPADVVSIPSDYNNAKGRTCRYEVVDELPLNEYKLPEVEIQDGYTDDYQEVTDDEEFIFTDEVDKVNPSAKVTETDVREIREYYKNFSVDYDRNFLISCICDDYGISRRQAKRIVDREAWKHVK